MIKILNLNQWTLILVYQIQKLIRPRTFKFFIYLILKIYVPSGTSNKIGTILKIYIYPPSFSYPNFINLLGYRLTPVNKFNYPN